MLGCQSYIYGLAYIGGEVLELLVVQIPQSFHGHFALRSTNIILGSEEQDEPVQSLLQLLPSWLQVITHFLNLLTDSRDLQER